ncbi:unnamed protein product, partial [marine sediment metagenome]
PNEVPQDLMDRLKEIATAWSFPFTSLRVRMPPNEGGEKAP